MLISLKRFQISVNKYQKFINKGYTIKPGIIALNRIDISVRNVTNLRIRDIICRTDDLLYNKAAGCSDC